MTGEEAVRNYKKGEELETTVLAIDPERERISLGVKQIDQDPMSLFMSEHSKDSILKGVIQEVDVKGATVELSDSVLGFIKASEISQDRVEDARTILKPGEEIMAKFIGIDRKNRIVNLSIKAKEASDEAQAIETYQNDTVKPVSGTSLGDLLKEQLDTD